MKFIDLENQAKAIALTVRDYCAKAMAPLFPRIDELEKQVKELAEKPSEFTLSEADIAKAAELAASKIPAPKDGEKGEKGEDGKGVTEYDINVALSVVHSKAAEIVTEQTSAAEVVLLQAIDKRFEKIVSEMPTPKNGKDGTPGIPGTQGEKGEPGQSFTIEQAQELVSKAVELIPKPVDGKDGTPGEKGEQGEPGKSFTLEEVQALIEQAEAKRQVPETVTLEQAQKMVDEAVVKAVASIQLPRDGKDGVDGRDAVALEILPSIEQAKSYPRNTYAIHKGGLFRSFEKTEAMRGWECIVEGLASIDFEKISDREFNVQLTKSNGSAVTHRASIPVPVYKGVHQEGETYSQGDMVTWAGAVWHCEEPTTEKPGEGSKGWRLAVKRGRDGKNGTNGRDLVKGMKI